MRRSSSSQSESANLGCCFAVVDQHAGANDAALGARPEPVGASNTVRFEARVAQNGFPAVTIRDLLKASLRHRPDRILLGEIRGAEAFDLLQLLNTGHSGTLSTVHANSAQQAIGRFTSCVLQSNVELPYRAIKSNIADSLNLLIHIERRPGRRFVSEVLRIAGYDLDHDRYAFDQIFDRVEES